MEFSNQLPNFDINIFDDEQSERIDGRFVPVYVDAQNRENYDGETSLLNQIVKENNTLSILLNGKQRLELEKTRGINFK